MQPFVNDPDIAEFAQASAATCAAASGSPAEIASTLAADGLLGVIAAEESGGLGLSLKFAQPVLWAAGQARLGFPLGETLAALPLLEAVLPEAAIEVASGAAILSATGASTLALSQEGVTGKAAAVPAGASARWLVAPLDRPLAIIDLTAGNVKHLPGEEIDPDLPRTTLLLQNHPVAAVVEDPDLVSDWQARDLIFRSIDAAAGAASSLDLAIGFLSTRSQFGKSLIGFQSLRHNLARAKMQLESLNRLIEVALLAPTPAERLSAAEIAYAQATATAPATIEMALHMHGGMGFTWDVPVHLYMRRVCDCFGSRGMTWARSAVADRVLEDIL